MFAARLLQIHHVAVFCSEFFIAHRVVALRSEFFICCHGSLYCYGLVLHCNQWFCYGCTFVEDGEDLRTVLVPVFGIGRDRVLAGFAVLLWMWQDMACILLQLP